MSSPSREMGPSAVPKTVSAKMVARSATMARVTWAPGSTTAPGRRMESVTLAPSPTITLEPRTLCSTVPRIWQPLLTMLRSTLPLGPTKWGGKMLELEKIRGFP